MRRGRTVEEVGGFLRQRLSGIVTELLGEYPLARKMVADMHLASNT